MYYFLHFPDRATWEAFGWLLNESGTYAYGPNEAFADIIGENYFQHEDGTQEPRDGFLVNISGVLPEAMQQYALATAPKYPKRVFA